MTLKINTAPLLGTIFITLKLCHVIDWSWWWVTAPFWIPAGFGAFVALMNSLD